MEEGVGEIVRLESNYAVRSALVRRLEAEASLAVIRAQREQKKWDREQQGNWSGYAVAAAIALILLVRFA